MFSVCRLAGSTWSLLVLEVVLAVSSVPMTPTFKPCCQLVLLLSLMCTSEDMSPMRVVVGLRLFLHSYGRWNGAIVGSGGPTTAQFAALWSALATKYKSQSKVIFGIMNEPHDLDIASWTVQVQAAVNAIRAAGAKTQYILLPGTGWTGGGSFISTNEPNLSKVTDPVGGTSLLIYDIHQYLDSDSSGTNTECVSDKISDIFAPITALLKSKGRKAFLSEIGASNAACKYSMHMSKRKSITLIHMHLQPARST